LLAYLTPKITHKGGPLELVACGIINELAAIMVKLDTLFGFVALRC